MRVAILRLFPLFLMVPIVADEAPWLIAAETRALRRADPVANAARHQAWVAKGRQPIDATSHLVDGSIDPTIIAPIELIDHLVVYNLEPQRVEKFRREWAARGAADLLGPDFWTRLETILAPLLALDRETRRLHALPQHERDLEVARKEPGKAKVGFNDDGWCMARAETLIAARREWGRETFDRFLYDVVAPGAYFWTSMSDPARMTTPEYWLEEWKWMEGGCR